MNANPNPYRASADLIRLLGNPDVEVWIIPRAHCESHPVAIAFYVPSSLAHLVPEAAPRPSKGRPPTRTHRAALAVLD